MRRQALRLIASVASVVILPVACERSSSPISVPAHLTRGAITCADTTATDLQAEEDYSANYLYRWQTYDGCAVRLDFIMTRSGACVAGVDEVLTDWPVGLTHDHHDYRLFVRDPNGVSTPENAKGFDPHASLPPGAEDTGLRQGGSALWMIPQEAQFIWIVGSEGVERWPRERSQIACA